MWIIIRRRGESGGRGPIPLGQSSDTKGLEKVTYQYKGNTEREGPKLSEWISVKDQLPEDGDSVLIFVPGWEDKYMRYRVAWIDYDESPPQWVNNGEIVENVTHWQPLPYPP
jgi:hypothetical protein